MKPPSPVKEIKRRTTDGCAVSTGWPEDRILALHAAIAPKELWKAVERLIANCLSVRALTFCLKLPELEGPGLVYSSNGCGEQIESGALDGGMVAAAPYLAANRGVKLVVLDDLQPSFRDLQESGDCDWRLHRLGGRRWIGVPCWRGRRMVGFLELFRGESEGEFTRSELEAIRCIHDHLNTAVNRVLRCCRERATRLALQSLLRGINRSMLLLDWDGELISATREARESLKVWEEANEAPGLTIQGGGVYLPWDILASVHGLKARYLASRRAGQAKSPMEVEVVPHPIRLGRRAAVRLVENGTMVLSLPLVLIEIDEVKRRDIRGPGGPAMTGELTGRERELVELVCEGLSNAEIAARLGRTIGSVKQQLTVIYGKLNVRSRARLIAFLKMPGSSESPGTAPASAEST